MGEAKPASGSGARPSRPLTLHLAVFAAALLLPILLVAGALLARYALAERDRYREIVLDASQDLAVALDQSLAGTGAVLQALAGSDALARGDVEAFRRQASALGRRLGTRFVLGGADGRVRADTDLPAGTPPPEAPDPALAPGLAVDAGTGLAVTDLLAGPGGRDFAYAVVVAVDPPGGAAGTPPGRLAAVRPVAALRDLMRRDDLTEDATAAYFDRRLVLAQRLEHAEDYLGTPPSEAFAQGVSGRAGTWIGRGKDGTDLLVGYATSRLSGWRATVGVPRTLVAGPARRSLLLLALAGAAMVAACALAASLLGGRIARPIGALAVAAREVGRGRAVAPTRSGIREVDAVSDALAAASVERAARQARLAESEERLRLALEAGRLGSWDLDLVTGKRLFSARSAEILGVEAGEAHERAAWTAFVHPDDQEPARAALAAALEGGAPYNVEFRVRTPEGERWVASQAMVLRDEAGRATRIIGIHRDVTRRREMEEKLRASEERLRATQEQASVGIAEVDADGRYLAVNEAFLAITGYARGGLIGRSLFSLSQPEDARADRERYARLVSGREPDAYALEKRFLRGDGSPAWIAVSASAVRDARGRFLYGVRFVQDVTARRLAEESRALLIHELNHRVKNTLATVQSVAMQSFRDVADADARHLFESRLLALSKAHDVLTREDWRGAGLREVVAEALAPYRGEDGGADRFLVAGPAVRLAPRIALPIAMALHELATNAVKYGALSVEGGAVTVAWSVARPAAGRRLRLRWEEAGGPPVRQPGRRGFGSRLIERGLARELDGEVSLDFAPTGVVCRIDVPLETGPRAAAGRAAA